jgi:phage tail sheath protein FI
MPVIASGNINPNSILAPNVYVQLQPPEQLVAQGLPTNIINYVGVASYGPIGVPVTIGGLDEYVQTFGPVLNHINDLGTAVAVAAQKFVNSFICVRAADGTETVSTAAVLDTTGTPVTGLTLTSLYKGAYANNIQAIVATGSSSSTATPTYKLSVSLPNQVPEVYDNIGGTGATLWANMVSAINNGQGSQSGPSRLVVATIGSATATPALSTYTLSGGTSGNTTITATTLLGADTGTRTGMYALRNTGIGVCALVGITDTTSFAAQTTFGLQEGKYMIACGPVGQTLAAAIAVKQAFTSPSYAFKYLVGDWESWLDATNNITRLVTPQAAECSLLSSLLPNQSGLNKEIVSIAGTQSTLAKRVYSQADIGSMMQNGIDCIAAPSSGGNYFAPQTGKNTSAIYLESDDSYSRLTPYIAYSLNAVGGAFVGELQTPDTRKKARDTIVTFLTNLARQGMIGDVNGGKPFSVVLDASNNPDSQGALGIMQADVRIVTYKVIYVFLINLQNGDVSLSSAVPNTAQNRRRLIL